MWFVRLKRTTFNFSWDSASDPTGNLTMLPIIQSRDRLGREMPLTFPTPFDAENFAIICHWKMQHWTVWCARGSNRSDVEGARVDIKKGGRLRSVSKGDRRPVLVYKMANSKRLICTFHIGPHKMTENFHLDVTTRHDKMHSIHNSQLAQNILH